MVLHPAHALTEQRSLSDTPRTCQRDIPVGFFVRPDRLQETIQYLLASDARAHDKNTSNEKYLKQDTFLLKYIQKNYIQTFTFFY